MKTIAFRFVLAFACVVGLAACDQDEDAGAEQPSFSEEALEPAEGIVRGDAVTLDAEPYANANSCKWHCKTCPPNKLCTQECYEIGSCNSDCGFIALCVEGYVWSDQACVCIPDPNAGEPCGAVTCPSGTECCNSSCGICVEPGGFCTQQACESI